MATSRFDTISKLFARRRAVAGDTISQAATPAASTWDGEKIPYLFVQSFHGGTIAPKADEDGTYTVTLAHGLGQTLYFADRPSRDVGAVPTEQFLQGLGFPDDNPPNAAIVVDDGAGGTDIAVVELTNPLIDPTVPAVIYDVKVLANWEDSTELGLQEGPADLSDLPESFGSTHLFIDDCPSGYVNCTYDGNKIGSFDNLPLCWNYALCVPCEPYGHTYPDRCAQEIWDHWRLKCNSTFPDTCNQGGIGCGANFTNSTLLCSSS